MSTLIVLIGGAHDGREFRVPDDDPIVTSGVLNLPAFDGPPPRIRSPTWRERR